MHPPIFVREPSAAERARLEAALRASDAFTVRRAQIVLASADGRRPRVIARELRCATQTVRNGVRAFNAGGIAALQAGSSGGPLRLGMHAAGRDDPEAKALACYGLWLPERERMLLRFVAGRPVSGITRAFLAWVAGRLAAEGMQALVLIWDNAPWHVSREVRAWIAAHDRRVKRDGGCRVLVCRLPGKSPRLDPVEPRRAADKGTVGAP